MARERNRKKDRDQAATEKEARRLTARVADLLEVPESTLGDLPSIELSGNGEAVVEGCKGVLEYSPERVRLGGGRLVITFHGRGLQLKAMTAHSAIVTGFIQSVEFTA